MVISEKYNCGYFLYFVLYSNIQEKKNDTGKVKVPALQGKKRKQNLELSIN